MRRSIVAAVVAFWAAAAQAEIVNNFNDILFWAGSGTNQAALVLDFGTAAPQASPPAVAWGYRWDGTASLADMMFALAGTISGPGAPSPVAGSDPRLGVQVTLYPNYNGPGANEYTVDAVTYDQNGLPPGWSQTIRSLVNDYDNSRGIAEYLAPVAGGAWPMGGLLQSSSSGLVGTVLDNGGWYGYVVAQYGEEPDFLYPNSLTFSQPAAAVPEPPAMALAACGFVALGLWMRRRGGRATLNMEFLSS